MYPQAYATVRSSGVLHKLTDVAYSRRRRDISVSSNQVSQATSSERMHISICMPMADRETHDACISFTSSINIAMQKSCICYRHARLADQTARRPILGHIVLAAP